MDDIEKEKTEKRKNIEDTIVKKIDESLSSLEFSSELKRVNKKLKELEERINEIDFTLQNFIQSFSEETVEEIHQEIFKRLNDLEDETKKLKKTLENMSFSRPVIVE